MADVGRNCYVWASWVRVGPNPIGFNPILVETQSKFQPKSARCRPKLGDPRRNWVEIGLHSKYLGNPSSGAFIEQCGVTCSNPAWLCRPRRKIVRSMRWRAVAPGMCRWARESGPGRQRPAKSRHVSACRTSDVDPIQRVCSAWPLSGRGRMSTCRREHASARRRYRPPWSATAGP